MSRRTGHAHSSFRSLSAWSAPKSIAPIVQRVSCSVGLHGAFQRAPECLRGWRTHAVPVTCDSAWRHRRHLMRRGERWWLRVFWTPSAASICCTSQRASGSSWRLARMGCSITWIATLAILIWSVSCIGESPPPFGEQQRAMMTRSHKAEPNPPPSQRFPFTQSKLNLHP